MPRVITDSLVHQAVQMYRSGKSFQQIGTELGVKGESLRIAVKRHGIELPRNTYRSHNAIPAPEGIAEAYTGGESVYALSQRFGVARNTINRWLTESGVNLRGTSEAGKVRSAKMTPEERAAQAAAANEAARGRTVSFESRNKAAITLAKLAAEGRGKRSPGEIQLGHWLNERGISYTPEQVVAGYNVDFGIEPVAVELLGGSWHAAPNRRAHHAERTHNILNAGWHMIYIWSTYNVPVGTDGADKLVALIQEARLNPAPVGKYWVLRGDGQLMASGGDEGDEFTLVIPSITNVGIRP